MTRVRLFVLPHGAHPTTPPEEAASFDVDVSLSDDDAVRKAIRTHLTERGFVVRTVNALAGVKKGDAPYAATVVAPPALTGPGGDA